MSDARLLDGSNPSWKHQGAGKWELMFQAPDEWMLVSSRERDEEVVVEPAVTYRPQGRVFVGGLVPE